jgi:hypothetical protein
MNAHIVKAAGADGALPGTFAVEVPYGKLHIEDIEIRSHLAMRAEQLAELLMLIQPPEGPSNMLWLAQQLADEVLAMVVAMRTRGVAS